MKKVILIALIICSVTSAFAKKVKFSVNMTGQTIDTMGVFVTGDFQAVAGFPGGDWIPNSTPMLPEVSDTNIYSVIVDIPAFTKYEYKFLNGDQTYNVEFVPYESRVLYNFNDNRWIYIDSLANDTSLIGPVMFGGNAPAGKYLLRLRVDMSNETMNVNGVHAAGDFQNFDPSTTQLYSFDGSMYEYIAYVDTGYNALVHEFRFVNGNTSAGYETIPGACAVNSNRGTTVPKDTILETFCFSSCTSCLLGISEQINLGSVSLFPNPATDYSIMEFKDENAVHDIIITDATGKTVRTYTAYSSAYLRLEKEDLLPGAYFISFRSNNSGPLSAKWIIQ